MSNDSTKAGPEGGHVLAKAAGRAAVMLGLDDAEISRVIGMDRPAKSRPDGAPAETDPTSQAGMRATLLVRLVLALEIAVGGNDVHRRLWFDSHNRDLGSAPHALMQTADGLRRVVEYLEQFAWHLTMEARHPGPDPMPTPPPRERTLGKVLDQLPYSDCELPRIQVRSVPGSGLQVLRPPQSEWAAAGLLAPALPEHAGLADTEHLHGRAAARPTAQDHSECHHGEEPSGQDPL